MIELTKNAEVMVKGVKERYLQMLKSVPEEQAEEHLRKECYYVHPALLRYALGSATDLDMESLVSMGYARQYG